MEVRRSDRIMTEVRSFWLDGTCYPCVRPGRTSKYLPHTVLYITMESMNWYSCVSLLSLSLWSIYHDARMQLQYFWLSGHGLLCTIYGRGCKYFRLLNSPFDSDRDGGTYSTRQSARHASDLSLQTEGLACLCH